MERNSESPPIVSASFSNLGAEKNCFFSVQAQESICIIFIEMEWLPGWVCFLACFALYFSCCSTIRFLLLFFLDIFFSLSFRSFHIKKSFQFPSTNAGYTIFDTSNHVTENVSTTTVSFFFLSTTKIVVSKRNRRSFSFISWLYLPVDKFRLALILLFFVAIFGRKCFQFFQLCVYLRTEIGKDHMGWEIFFFAYFFFLFFVSLAHRYLYWQMNNHHDVYCRMYCCFYFFFLLAFRFQLLPSLKKSKAYAKKPTIAKCKRKKKIHRDFEALRF